MGCLSVEKSHPLLTSSPPQYLWEEDILFILGRELDGDTYVPEKSLSVSQAEQWEVHLLQFPVILMCQYL